MRICKTKIGKKKGKQDVIVLELSDMLHFCRKQLEKEYELEDEEFLKILLPKVDSRGRERRTKLTAYFPYKSKK